MNFFATDILTPNSGSVDKAVYTARTAGATSSVGVKKSFSDVLQRVRGGGEKDALYKADDVQSSNESDERSQIREMRSRNGSSSRTDSSETSLSRMDEKRSSDSHTSTITERSLADTDSSPVGSQIGTVTQDLAPVLMTALVPYPIETAVIEQEQAHAEGSLLSTEDGRRGTSLPSPTVQSPETGSLAPQTKGDVAPQSSAVSAMMGQGEQVSGEPVVVATSDSRSSVRSEHNAAVADGSDGTPADAIVETGSVSPKRETGAPIVEPDVFPQKDSLAQLGTKLAGRTIDGLKTDSNSLVSGVRVEQPVSSHSEGHTESLSDDHNMESNVKLVSSYGYRSDANMAEQFSDQWFDQSGRQHDQPEGRLPQAVVDQLQVANGKLPESLPVGAFAQSIPNPQLPPVVSSQAVPQPSQMMAAHDNAVQSVPSMMRSVVLDVTQPDLGHVNIRVAMVNEYVHTHLSTDRAEVGQFLANGQDRLLTAFQTNGLEMGQFRVDIDRQSTGRSFQQGLAHEQNRGGNQDSQWSKGAHTTDWYDDSHSPLRGLLNVVA